ncbi:MAG: uracil-xanthine permease [Ruminococcaceae bacterium]|nr:uracil-xanthine permease [Oscillospiraceae bacterium]
MGKNLIYDIHDKPKFGQMLIFAFQQVLAILAATILVPAIIGHGMSQAAALFGAGVGTIVYQLFTKFRSPVFLGSSFAFIGSMLAAFGGAVSASAGYAGIILGAIFAGLVYVVIAIIVKFAGVAWINKLMPTVVIGPTVALIGLSLAVNAVNDLTVGKVLVESTSQVIKDGAIVEEVTMVSGCSPYVALICGLVTVFSIFLFSVYGKKMAKLIPFVLGIGVGYVVASVFTVIGIATNNVALQVINFSAFANMQIFAIPEFTFFEAFKGVKEIDGSFIATIAVAYIPVAFVVFAEHIADHKNLSSIIDKDLLENPGLHRTLLGDGVGSVAGAFFGGCPNTTYGESVGCVAITKNASVVTITTAAIMCMVISFFGPFVTLLSSIPNCVMGGVCVALYGFIAVSGLKMIQKVDLGDSKNLFVVSAILIPGIGGLTVSFGEVTITTIACALILGIVTNILLNRNKEKAE